MRIFAPQAPSRIRINSLGLAALNLAIPAQAAALTTYYILRLAGSGEHAYVDALSYVLPWVFTPTALLLPFAIVRRARLLIPLAALPLIVYIAHYGPCFLPKSPTAPLEPTLSVMSYNVWWRNEHHDRIVAAIQSHSADVVALQEVNESILDGIEPELADQYPYRIIDRDQAIFSRFPLKDYQRYLVGDTRSPVIVQHATLELNGIQVGLLNVHTHSPWLMGKRLAGLPFRVPTGLQNKFRDMEIRELMQVVDSMEGPLIMLGDFNLTDQQVIYRELASRFIDAHQEVGWGLGFTRTHVRPLQLPMWRIDYVFYTSDLAALSVDHGAFAGSDHRPVVAELAFRSVPGIAISRETIPMGAHSSR